MANGIGFKQSDFYADIARGKVPNAVPEHRGGLLEFTNTSVPAFDDMTVWNTDGDQKLWTPPPALGTPIELYSDSASDDGKVVRIGYLTYPNWNEEYINVTLARNGSGVTAIANPSIVARVNTMRIVQGTAPAVGKIHVRMAGAPSTIYRTISIGTFRAQACHMSVPAGMSYYHVLSKIGSVSSINNAAAHFRIFSNGADTNVARTVFEEVAGSLCGASVSQVGQASIAYPIPIKFCEKSDIYVNVHCSKAIGVLDSFTASCELSGWFE